MVVAERVASGFGGLLVEPAARENASSRLDPHHCGTSAGVLDRRFALEAGPSPVVDIALTADVVVRHAIVRQADDRFLPAAPPQFAGIIGKRLANAFDVVEQSDFAADELADPDRHSVGAMAGTPNIHERLHG